jgi:hypothetical protein
MHRHSARAPFSDLRSIFNQEVGPPPSDGGKDLRSVLVVQERLPQMGEGLTYGKVKSRIKRPPSPDGGRS